MTKLVKGFVADESGATAIEYALIAALIALGIVAAGTKLGTAISTKFDNIRTALGNAKAAQ